MHRHSGVAYSWVEEWERDSCPCRYLDERSRQIGKKNVDAHFGINENLYHKLYFTHILIGCYLWSIGGV